METAVLLLPLLTPRYLDRGDQQHVLGGYAGVASDAAALALADTRDGRGGLLAAAQALRLLEAGRRLLLSQAYETRSDLTDLRRGDHPGLAGRFASIRDRLNRPPDAAPGGPPGLAGSRKTGDCWPGSWTRPSPRSAGWTGSPLSRCRPALRNCMPRRPRGPSSPSTSASTAATRCCSPGTRSPVSRCPA